MNAQRLARHSEAFALSSGQKRSRIKSEKHLKFLRELPCCICHGVGDVHAAHIRMGALQYGKPSTGIGTKPDDRWAVPLCAAHHVFGKGAQHSMSEEQFWKSARINPFVLALALWGCSGDERAAMAILRETRAAWD